MNTIKIIGGFVGVVALGSLIVMFLWNGLVAHPFRLPTISFWMTFGIVFLIAYLYGWIKKYRGKVRRKGE